MPSQPISYGASAVTQLAVKGNKLYRNGSRVQIVSIDECLFTFKEFLQNIKNPVLVGHNIDNFDSMVLCNKLLNSSHTLAYNPNARRAYEKCQHAEDFGRIKLICTFNSL